VFSLDYVADPPLSAVLHSRALTSYRLVFHLLFQAQHMPRSRNGTPYMPHPLLLLLATDDSTDVVCYCLLLLCMCVCVFFLSHFQIDPLKRIPPPLPSRESDRTAGVSHRTLDQLHTLGGNYTLAFEELVELLKKSISGYV